MILLFFFFLFFHCLLQDLLIKAKRWNHSTFSLLIQFLYLGEDIQEVDTQPNPTLPHPPCSHVTMATSTSCGWVGELWRSSHLPGGKPPQCRVGLLRPAGLGPGKRLRFGGHCCHQTGHILGPDPQFLTPVLLCSVPTLSLIDSAFSCPNSTLPTPSCLGYYLSHAQFCML